MLEHQISCLPVLENGALVGIVSWKDLLRVMRAAGSRSDGAGKVCGGVRVARQGSQLLASERLNCIHQIFRCFGFVQSRLPFGARNVPCTCEIKTVLCPALQCRTISPSLRHFLHRWPLRGSQGCGKRSSALPCSAMPCPAMLYTRYAPFVTLPPRLWLRVAL